MNNAYCYHTPTSAEVAEHNRAIQGQIDDLNRLIRKAQEQHDLLAEFKGRVETYDSNFDGISRQKKTTMNYLDVVIKNCEDVGLYLSGMNETFVDMVDNRIPTGIFDFFYNKINTKLKMYEDDIRRWQRQIDLLRSQMW